MQGSQNFAFQLLHVFQRHVKEVPLESYRCGPSNQRSYRRLALVGRPRILFLIYACLPKTRIPTRLKRSGSYPLEDDFVVVLPVPNAATAVTAGKDLGYTVRSRCLFTELEVAFS